jgi:hypothetical protein
MIDTSKKLLSVSEKRGDGSTRSPVVTGQPDEARRRHEPTRPVRGDREAQRRTRNDKIQHRRRRQSTPNTRMSNHERLHRRRIIWPGLDPR